jgi:pilus assembly protein Flp/PilA
MLTKLYVKMQALRGDEGATALEYAILVGFIAVVVIGGATLLGANINGLFTAVAQKVQNIAAGL